jgi:hypothetical protein
MNGVPNPPAAAAADFSRPRRVSVIVDMASLPCSHRLPGAGLSGISPHRLYPPRIGREGMTGKGIKAGSEKQYGPALFASA